MVEESTSDQMPMDNSQTDRFLKLFLAHQKLIYTSILVLVPNDADADDLLQETASVMWRKFDEFEEGSNFAAWAVSIARYQVLNFRKKRRGKEIQLSDNILELIAEQVLPKLNSYLDTRLSALEVCLNKLAERDRTLIQMRYEKDITIKEISKRAKRPIHGLYKAMSRIHNALLQCVRLRLAAEETS